MTSPTKRLTREVTNANLHFKLLETLALKFRLSARIKDLVKNFLLFIGPLVLIILFWSMVRDRQHFKSFPSKPMSFLNPHQGWSRTTTQPFFNQVHDIIDWPPTEALLVENDQSSKKQRGQKVDHPMILLKM
ncbi:MAG: hypothetical protein OXC64_00800 [Flavobacteriaceae bacterium]|nr:hypothetical protein [Flavobacteriaceae bacterium]